MHTRDHRSLLADAEKRLLVAMARRLPPSINSDHLTLLGLAAMVAAGVFFARIPAAPWSAAAFVAALVLNWFGDSLDGTVARVRDQQRPRYGYYVDHVLDLAGTAALLAGIAQSGLMQPWIALVVAAAFFLVAAERFLATHACGIFRLSFAWFGPTELRVVLAIGAVVAIEKPWVHVFGFHARLFDVGGLVAAAGMIVAFGVAAIRNTRALYLAEPLPTRADDKHNKGMKHEASTTPAGDAEVHVPLLRPVTSLMERAR
jgi:archaetidylinositol phosphate synthase